MSKRRKYINVNKFIRENSPQTISGMEMLQVRNYIKRTIKFKKQKEFEMQKYYEENISHLFIKEEDENIELSQIDISNNMNVCNKNSSENENVLTRGDMKKIENPPKGAITLKFISEDGYFLDSDKKDGLIVLKINLIKND